jgi:DNA adenine methylase
MDKSSATNGEIALKPFMKWAGGKRQLLPQLKENAPPKYGTFFEPFVGGGALFFAIQPSRAVIGDVNEELINAYTEIRDNPLGLLHLLSDFKNEESFYYETRSLDPTKMTSVEKAARTIYMNKTCFNGLYRVNKSGKFNVPFGRYKNPRYADSNLLNAISNYLKGVEIVLGDFSWVLKKAKKGDFIYFDPPYHPLNETSHFTSYTKYGFGRDEQVILRDTFKELSDRGVCCLLSNSYCDFILDLYEDFAINTVMANRSINSKAEGRGKIKEVLVRNY